MLNNPFRKRKSITEKFGEALHVPHKASGQEVFIKKLQHSFLYVSLFLAGYIIAKLQTLMN